MENTVEIRYAGVVVGRSGAVRDLDASGVFIAFTEPLPVGTRLSLKMSDGVREARIGEVIESADPAATGMRVRFVEGAAPVVAPSGGSAPVPVAAPAPLPPAVAAPASAGPVEAMPEEASGPASEPSGSVDAGSGLADGAGGNGHPEAGNRGADDGGQGPSSGRRRRRRR